MVFAVEPIVEPSRILEPLKVAPGHGVRQTLPERRQRRVRLASAAPGSSAAVSAVWIELIVVMIEFIAVVAVSSVACPSASAELVALTRPELALSWVAIAHRPRCRRRSRPRGRSTPGCWTIARFCWVMGEIL